MSVNYYKSMLILACMAGNTAMAAPVLNETFAYTTGSLVGNGAWSNFSGTAGQVDVVNEGSLTLPLPYPQAADTGAVNITFAESEDVATPFDGSVTFSSGTAYYSMLLRMTGIPGTGGAYLAMFKPTAGNTADFHARLWVKAVDATTYNFGISTASAGSGSNPGVVPIYETTARNLNETYLVVVKYQFQDGALNDITSVFVNPTPGAAEPSTPDTTHTNFGVSGDASSIGVVALRQASGIGTMIIDDLRVGATFTDVAPAAASVGNWDLY